MSAKKILTLAAIISFMAVNVFAQQTPAATKKVEKKEVKAPAKVMTEKKANPKVTAPVEPAKTVETEPVQTEKTKPAKITKAEPVKTEKAEKSKVALHKKHHKKSMAKTGKIKKEVAKPKPN